MTPQLAVAVLVVALTGASTWASYRFVLRACAHPNPDDQFP